MPAPSRPWPAAIPAASAAVVRAAKSSRSPPKACTLEHASSKRTSSTPLHSTADAAECSGAGSSAQAPSVAEGIASCIGAEARGRAHRYTADNRDAAGNCANDPCCNGATT